MMLYDKLLSNYHFQPSDVLLLLFFGRCVKRKEVNAKYKTKWDMNIPRNNVAICLVKW